VEINFMDEALLAEDLMEFGGEVRVLEPRSLANRIERGLSKVVSDHA
jgi:proteasome accessory factor B